MGSRELINDHISRSGIRLAWIDALYFHESYADVVLESFEVIELCLRALLMKCGVCMSDIHDVSSIIEENRTSLRSLTDAEVVEISKISRHLRRDRELAFYGNEDLTPSEFYREEDAELAKSQAIDVVRLLKSLFYNKLKMVTLSKRIACLVLVSFLISCGGGSEAPQEVQSSAKCSLGPDLVKIMPLGDSITESAKEHNSYRRSLYFKLLNSGCNVDFVGSRKGVWDPRTRRQVMPLNSDFDSDHEGYWGYRTDQVLPFVSERVREYAPDIVLVHLGSNDVADGESIDEMILELSQLVDLIRAEKPNVSIILAELIPGDNNDGIILLNKEIRKLGALKNTTESPVIVVDQYSGYEFSDSFDGVDPGESGEEKMAEGWFEGMK